MKPKIVCADYAFPLLHFDATLDLISAMGFDGVDIGLFAGGSHVDPNHVLNDVKASARRLADSVSSRGLMIADMFLTPGKGFADLAPNHPDPAERKRSREWFLRALDFTAESGAHHVSALPGVEFRDVTFEENLRLCAEELAWRAEKAAELGFDFGIEPHIGSICPRPSTIQALLDRAPGLTLALDWAHLSSVGVVDAEIKPLLARTSHFHARCARPGRLQAPMTENTIDFEGVLEEMAAVGYAGAIAVEYVWIEWQGCNEVDNVSETVLLRDLLLRLIARMPEAANGTV